MYVVPEETYKSIIEKSPKSLTLTPNSLQETEGGSYHSPKSLQLTPNSLQETQGGSCHICGKYFKHINQLAHHLKSHVLNGYKCNICGKVFMHKRTLSHHLSAHPPQSAAGAPQSAAGAPQSAAGAPQSAARVLQKEFLHCRVCNKKVIHKRNLARHEKSHSSSRLLNFVTSKWQTL
jgi:hypothetical protein